MGRPNKRADENDSVGGIIFCLSDMELAFTGMIMKQIKEMYQNGASPEIIGEKFNRDPDEIFIALFQLARQGEIDHPMANRIF